MAYSRFDNPEPSMTIYTGNTLYGVGVAGAAQLTGNEEAMTSYHDPVRQAEKDSLEFVLWLNGALDVLDTTAPTQDQWNKLREKTLEQVGHIVMARMQKAAQPNQTTIGDYRTKAAGQMAAQLKHQMDQNAFEVLTQKRQLSEESKTAMQMFNDFVNKAKPAK